tara:strand:+ start:728 stop:1174 length:447 start_codon:yes stop_codon:yes gene_type:complete
MFQRSILGDFMGYFDLDKYLPLKEEDRPEGVITLEGVESYEEFAEKEVTKHHQHGAVSPLMSVLGRGGATAQNMLMASETFSMESYMVPEYAVRENYGQTFTPNIEPNWMIREQLTELRDAFPDTKLNIPKKKLIGASSLLSLSPFGV